jgi:hypothetical protein
VRPFDFIIDGELVRKSLEQHLLEHNISSVSRHGLKMCTAQQSRSEWQERRRQQQQQWQSHQWAAAAAAVAAAQSAALVAVLEVVVGCTWHHSQKLPVFSALRGVQSDVFSTRHGPLQCPGLAKLAAHACTLSSMWGSMSDTSWLVHVLYAACCRQQESVVEVEYVPAVVPPEPQTAMPQNDW